MTSGRALARAGLAALAFASLLAVTRSGLAHELRPGSLEIATVGGGRYEVSWNAAPGEEAAHVSCPPAAHARTPTPARIAASSSTAVRRASRATASASPASRLSGTRCSCASTSERARRSPRCSPPRARRSWCPPRPQIVRRSRRPSPYATAGAEHLITGLDHVLFVLGLLLLVRSPGALVRAITAVHARAQPHARALCPRRGEASTGPGRGRDRAQRALLARELARPPAEPTLIQRRPWVAAFGFGLLHGLGFAGGLAVFQLPAGRSPRRSSASTRAWRSLSSGSSSSRWRSRAPSARRPGAGPCGRRACQPMVSAASPHSGSCSA